MQFKKFIKEASKVKNDSIKLIGALGISKKVAPRLRETLMFKGPGSQKQPQLQPKNAPEIDNLSHQKFEGSSNRVFIDFTSVLVTFWDPFGRQNRLK